MHRLLIHIIILNLVFSGVASGQLSPGDLVNVHADLEGVFNCTKCHSVGAKIDQNKCLSCHLEVKSRLEANKGYHSASTVKEKSCVSCHSDHHGRKFEIIRFDQKTFDHTLTGYTLKGDHLTTDCKECHTKQNILDQKIKSKVYTFLGLAEKCVSCHEDVHQGSLDDNCAQCHDFKDFKPATLFKHDETKFVLKGEHKQVDCKECHPISLKSGKSFQQFSGLTFNQCSSCHEDPHANKLGSNCAQCHTENSFHDEGALKKFNHQQTRFTLKGRHKQVACMDCHLAPDQPEQVFQDFVSLKTFNCTRCHEDVHRNELGHDCGECHNEESFKSKQLERTFDHNLTNFHLQGRHQQVDCKECHVKGFLQPLVHDKCMNCHQDSHEGQFGFGSSARDCAECHQVFDFKETTYSIEQHKASKFPLTGAHEATSCTECHHKGKLWIFKNLKQACVDCHQDIHQGVLADQFYPDKNCQSCHQTTAWTEVQFDHGQTNFSLEGAHANLACVGCHKKTDTPLAEKSSPVFAKVSADCVQCHQDVHNHQFEEAMSQKPVDCKQCHGWESWSPSNFDHNTARFKLDGKHKDVACDRCHYSVNGANGPYILYRNQKLECIDCHS